MRLVALLSVLFAGCARPPAVEAVAAALARGDLSAARPLLADCEHPATAQWQALLARYDALGAQRKAIRTAETALLAAAVEEALAEGRFADAAAPLQAGLLHAAEPKPFSAFLAQLEAAADTAPAAEAAAAWGALAGVYEFDPKRLHPALRRHRHAAVQARYAPGRLDETRAAQAGILRSAAGHLLARIDREYHVVPPWTRALQEARDHTAALVAGIDAQAHWPRLETLQVPPIPEVADLDDMLLHLAATVDAGRSAGLPEEVVVDTWVEGVLAGLDPWTRAVWPAEMAAWEQHHAGVSLGVGLELDQTPAGSVRVVRPLPDSPAWSSGIHQDDLLLVLEDDRFVTQLSDIDKDRRLAVAEQVLAGEPGTAVALTVARGEERLKFSVHRGTVPHQTVSGYQRRPDNEWDPWLDEASGLAYVRITAFREASEPDFDALTESWASEARGLVLDLRGNAGGDVNAAVQIGDRFVADGILAELSGRVKPETGPDVDPTTGQELLPWNAALPGHAFEATPTVVLVDDQTASAAELLAGLLQERAGAVVVGEATWGKGLAQALRAEPELGYGVQFTNQVWTLPSGRRLSREVEGGGGIQPDLVDALSPGESFQVRLLAETRSALRSHHDGTPMRLADTRRREDLPPLEDDPLLLLAQLVLHGASATAAPVP